jgi:hypothetical protein
MWGEISFQEIDLQLNAFFFSFPRMRCGGEISFQDIDLQLNAAFDSTPPFYSTKLTQVKWSNTGTLEYLCVCVCVRV